MPLVAVTALASVRGGIISVAIRIAVVVRRQTPVRAVPICGDLHLGIFSGVPSSAPFSCCHNDKGPRLHLSSPFDRRRRRQARGWYVAW